MKKRILTAYPPTISFTLALVILGSCTSKQDDEPSLKEAYRDFFYFGTAMNTPQILGEDTVSLRIIEQHFNAVTAENIMKWEFIQPRLGEFDFELADKMVEFAERNNMHVVGHALVWHSQVPKWVFEDENGNPATRELLLERMRNHIHTVVGRYKGRVHSWDVVNEALAEDGSLRQSKWFTIIGEDYIQKAFEFAHEIDPEAVLIYNDYNLAFPEKREGTVRMVKGLQEKGVPIHAIGMQGHYLLNTPPIEYIEASIQAYSALGVEVMVTELDINMLPFPTQRISADVGLSFEQRQEWDQYSGGLPDSIQVEFTRRYTDLFELFLKYSDVITRVTIWGVHDGLSWLNNWPIRGRTNYPLLFDRNHQPKPAVDSIIRMANMKRLGS